MRAYCVRFKVSTRAQIFERVAVEELAERRRQARADAQAVGV